MDTSMNRRGFLGRSALGAAAGLAALSAEAAPSKRVVVGVMGLKRGLALSKTFAARPGVELRYVCDVDSKRVHEAARTIEKDGVAHPTRAADNTQSPQRSPRA